MIHYRNNDERYGSDSSVYEAESLEAVVTAMEPTLRDWAQEAWDREEEPSLGHDAFVAATLQAMRDECLDGLEIVEPGGA